MERMEGVDAGFLYMETPAMHMHTVKVAILERTGGFDFDAFIHEVMARLDKLPPFRQRILMDPLHLNHPLWITDRDIDPARHIFRVVVPPPADMGALEKAIGQIVSVPLDRSVPLWELHVCEGLEGGRVAVVAKLHHALADGNAANNLLANATGAVTAREAPATFDRTPSRARLVRAALVDATKQAFSLPALLVRTARSLTGWSGCAAARRSRRRVRSWTRRAPRSTAASGRAATSPPARSRSTTSRRRRPLTA